MTALPNCGTCKYWGDHEDEGARWRRCVAVKHGVVNRNIDLQEAANYDDNLLPIVENRTQYTDTPIAVSRATVVDGSGYFAALKCEADFGCVLHEPLESPDA